MTIVTKTVKFDAAHVLTNHRGLCKNLHGHTYRVDVSVAQSDGDESDMVIDFKDLKKIAAEVVCDQSPIEDGFPTHAWTADKWLTLGRKIRRIDA